MSKSTFNYTLSILGGIALIVLALYAADIRLLLLALGRQYQIVQLTKGSGEYLWENPYLRGAVDALFLGAALLCFWIGAWTRSRPAASPRRNIERS